jgi:hypothetical protein
MTRSQSILAVRMRCSSAVLLLAVSAGLSGCTSDFGDVAKSGLITSGSANGVVSGIVHGGQQPVSGSTVQLWAVGTGGYGSTASPIGSSATTGANGGFNLGTPSCPSNSYAYITASGGDPQIASGAQSGSGNTAIALMAALGPCSGISGATYVNINEVTTVAAVFAMAQFGSFTANATLVSGASKQTPVDTFGTNSTNVQGIANAMQIAQILASNPLGASSASSGNPSTTTPANVSVEYGQINTLADILALCVNSTGVASTPCAPVITAATPSGGTAPSDTIQIALNLALNPTIGTGAQGDLNTSAYNAITGTPPFQPYDSAAPNDWTIGFSVSTGTSDSRWIAIDGYGNAWVTTSGTAIYEIDPTTGNTYSATKLCTAGCTVATPAPTTTSISASYEVAVDTANNAWVSDTTSGNIYKIAGSSSAGVEAPGLIIGTTGATADTVVAGPAATTGVNAAAGNLQAIVVDGSNNVWATVTGTSGGNAGVLVEVANGTTTATTGGPLTVSPFGMAVDMSNQSKFGNTTLSGGGSFVYSVDSAGCNTLAEANGGTADNETAGSIAMDFTTSAPNGAGTYAAGAATPLSYLSDSTCSTSTKIYNSTTNTFSASPYGIAFDNNNAMWIVDQNYTTLATGGAHYSLTKMAPQNYSNYSAFTGAAVGGTSTAPGITFTSIPGTTGGLNVPYYLAMDGAGAAWVGNSAGAPLSAFTNAGAAISPATGFVGGACSGCTNASTTGTSPTYLLRKYSGSRGVAVDGSGNVWEANTGTAYVTVVVGVASPTVTPLATGIKSGTLASKP